MKKLLIGLLSCLMVFVCATGCGLLPPAESSSNSESVNTESTDSVVDSNDSTSSDTSLPVCYTLTLRNGNPMTGGTSEEFTYAEGATLELPTLTAEGKTFKGWFAMDDNGDLTVEAPATMPAESIALYAVWEITPYTLTIKQEGAEDKVIIFGVDVPSPNPTNIEASISNLAFVLEDNLPENTDEFLYSWAEEIPETFTLQNYTFTVVAEALHTLTLINGNPRLDPNAVTTSNLLAGTELELPTLTADGKIFKGWFDVENNAAPEVMPADYLTLYATWDIIPYTLTIKQEGAEDKVFTFGVEYSNDILISVNDLGTVLKKNLPANTMEKVYSWAEDVPETFALDNYTFTVVEAEAPKYTLTLINGNPRLDPDAVTTSELFEGTALELPTLTAKGKIFKGWFDIEDNAAPETMPADFLTLYAVWEVIPYTLTIKQDGVEDKVFTFGIEYSNDILISVNDLGTVLKENLPTNTETVSYEYDRTIPETFALDNYIYTIKSIETISITDALALGNGLANNKYTTEEYFIVGTVINVAHTTYGNLTIADEAGNTIYVYGTYLADGTRYDAMDKKPTVGDLVKYRSTVGNYNGLMVQLKNAVVVELTTPETVTDIHKVLAESFNVNTLTTISEAGDVSVATVGAIYADVAITWTSSNTEIAVINGGTITYTLPVEDTEITLTATCKLNDTTKVVTFTVEVEAAPVAGQATVSVDFSTIASTDDFQYVDEVKYINENLTISSHNSGCHFTTQLRIYDSASNDGWVILTCAGKVTDIAVNMGYKKADLDVYGSTDGLTWVKVGVMTSTGTGYKDYSLDIDESKGYTYLKLDSVGAQLRIKTLTVSMIG